MRTLRRLFALALILYLGAWAFRIVYRKFYIWLPGYVTWLTHQEKATTSPVHVFFFFTDHFEPSNFKMVQQWLDQYPPLADRHRDSDGRRWQHTWFYPGEQPVDANLAALKILVTGGYGEAELHLHHSNDTEESGRQRFQSAIEWFQKFGFLISAEGKTQFAFVHGVWGLDNSNGPAFCGLNREITLLHDLGCFADFTFSSIRWNSQPSMVNNIYEATDDDRPKSYDYGVPLRLGRKPQGDLVIFQGPLLFLPTFNLRRALRNQFFEAENGEIHAAMPVTESRIDSWVKANIHVEGRPDWVFVKVHGHGGTEQADANEILGPEMDRSLTYLEKTYGDRTRYVLHYINAREAFNLARAAVDGKQGDPRLFYDYVIPPYRTGPPR